MSRRAFLGALVLASICGTSDAQVLSKLVGTVRSQESGETIPGVNVAIEGLRLGAVTDRDGRYAVIGVSPGSYTIKASYIGFETVTVRNVTIHSGLTHELNIELVTGTAALDELVVEYERPLIQRDAIGVSRVVTASEIEKLPVRGVSAVAGLQAGVVEGGGREELHVQGGRDEETVFFVDGVKVIGYSAVPQHAILEQEMLIGSLPAKYGDAMSGIVSITTKSGGAEHFGAVEAISSGLTDDRGYSLASASAGGPLVSDKVSFFVAGEYVNNHDPNPSAVPIPALPADRYEFLQEFPQSLRFLDHDGNRHYLPFPADAPPTVDTNDDGILDAIAFGDVMSAMSIPDGLTLDSPFPVSAAEVEPLSNFVFRASVPNRRLRLWRGSGSLTFRLTDEISLRATGRFEDYQRSGPSWRSSLFNADRSTASTSRTSGFGLTATQRLSPSTFYQLHADWSQFSDTEYDPAISSRLEDVLWYGDIDHPANAVARRYRFWSAVDSLFIASFEDGDLPASGGVFNLYHQPGVGGTSFSKDLNEQLRFTANATTQRGMHQLEFGGEFEIRTERRFEIDADGLARFYEDGSVEGNELLSVTRYDELPFSAVRGAVDYWGFDYLGLEEANEQDIDRFVEGVNGGCNEMDDGPSPACDIAPYKPVYYAGYVQDKFEYKDLVVNLGLRVDLFDNNTFVLRDRYSLVPIVRANSVSDRPANIGSDFAVYFDAEGAVVGYRDLEGNFFNDTGQDVSGVDLNLLGSPKILDSAGGYLSTDVFEDYQPELTWLPRIGLSFSITDLALFFAHIDRTAQRPFEVPFDGLKTYWEVSQQYTFLANNNLRPATTTEYEVGFRHRLGSRSAVTLSGFYKKVEGLIRLERLQLAYPSGYVTWSNRDFGTIKGLEVEFDLRRTGNVAVNANYTLNFALGTGSNAQTARARSWEPAPLFIAPLDFDRRHALTANVDYRLGEDEGPLVFGTRLFANAAVNLLFQLHSGHPYSRLSDWPLRYVIGQPNSETMPWSSLINARIEKRFSVGDQIRVSPFVWVQNLLDTDNVTNVYSSTGLPNEDGYRRTGVAADFFARQERPGTAREMYGWLINYPGNYGSPRLIRLGVRIDL